MPNASRERRPISANGRFPPPQNRDLTPMRQFESRTAAAVGALAIGALAIGALAIGTIAVGSFAIKRLSVLDARLRSLSVEELSVGWLRVEKLTVSGTLELPAGSDSTT